MMLARRPPELSRAKPELIDSLIHVHHERAARELPRHRLRNRRRTQLIDIRLRHLERLDLRPIESLRQPTLKEGLHPSLLTEVQEQGVITLDRNIARRTDIQARIPWPRHPEDARNPACAFCGKAR